MKPVRVLHLLWSFDVGGAEKFVMSFIRNVDRSRCAPGLCVFADQGDLRAEAEGLSVPLFTVQAGSPLVTIVRLSRVVKSFNPDLLHAHSLAPGFYAAVVGAVTRTPVLTTRHGRPEESTQRSTVRGISNRLTGRFIAVSEEVRRLLIARSGIRADKIFTVVNGINTAAFRGPADRRVRNELGIPESAFLFGTVGRLDRTKAQGNMIAALRVLVGEGRDVHLIIAGEGQLRGRLEDEAGHCGLAQRVRLIGTWHDVPGLLHSFDAFVLSSVDEGVPLSLLEAMAAGVPVVATEVGGIPEVVTNEESGLLVTPGDVGALACAMARIADEPGLAGRMAATASETVRKRFSIDGMINAYHRHYHALTGRPRAEVLPAGPALPSPGRLSRYAAAAVNLFCDEGVDQPVLVLESDDWGQSGTPDRETYDGLLRASVISTENIWATDALETIEDIEHLGDTLARIPDAQGRPLPVTANFIVSNPDFAAVVAGDGAELPFISLNEEHRRNPVSLALREAWAGAVRVGVLCPEYHGRWHLAPEALLRCWRQDVAAVRECVRRNVRPAGLAHNDAAPLLSEYVVVRGGRFVPRPRVEQEETIERGVGIFTEVFGRKPASTVAPHYLWDEATEYAWRKAGIRSIQAATRHLSVRRPLGFLRARRISMGRVSSAGMVYLYRNCRFEPVLYGDTAGRAFAQVRAAFDSKRPAVVGCHRVNFSGRLFPERRDHVLKELARLLTLVRESFPNVCFLTSAELAERFLLHRDRKGKLSAMTTLAGRGRFLFGRLVKHARR